PLTRLESGRGLSGALPAEALLQLLDPGLQAGYAVLQLFDAPLQDLASPGLVAQQAFDTAQGLRNGNVLLVEAFQPTVDLVEMPENVAEARVDLHAPGVEAPFEPVEASVDQGEAVVDAVETTVDRIEALINRVEALIDRVEATVDRLETL